MKLFISKKLNYDDEKVFLISDFIIFCAEHLPIENNFEADLSKPAEDQDLIDGLAFSVKDVFDYNDKESNSINLLLISYPGLNAGCISASDVLIHISFGDN